jgi:hypothetical protein
MESPIAIRRRPGFTTTDLATNSPISDDERCQRFLFDRGGIVMASDLIDLTIPAHDPNFPKPRGLLPVPPEVAENAAKREAQLLRERGIQITAEARQHSLDCQTLNWYYDNSLVLCRPTPEGVEVLAVGSDEIGEFLKEHPFETLGGAVIEVA